MLLIQAASAKTQCFERYMAGFCEPPNDSFTIPRTTFIIFLNLSTRNAFEAKMFKTNSGYRTRYPPVGPTTGD
jgi:hypothetical protein